MICNKCGCAVDDKYNICPQCGNILYREAQAQPIYEAQPNPQPQPQQPVYQQPAPPTQVYVQQPIYVQQPQQNPGGTTSILVLGILSLVFMEVPILGFILGIIAKSKANTYKKATGSLTGKAKAGKIMGIIGFIFNILIVLAYVIYALVFAGLLAGAALYY